MRVNRKTGWIGGVGAAVATGLVGFMFTRVNAEVTAYGTMKRQVDALWRDREEGRTQRASMVSTDPEVIKERSRQEELLKEIVGLLRLGREKESRKVVP